MTDQTGQWRRCNACKEPIGFGAVHWVCSVSTCNRKRTGMVFCTVTCWEIHLPVANHREAWAVEQTAPSEAELRAAAAGQKKAAPPRRRIVASEPRAQASPPKGDVPIEVLVVASRLKDYIRAKSGFNTSDQALGPLSNIIRNACDKAIRSAEREGRKTVLDRDIPRP